MSVRLPRCADSNRGNDEIGFAHSMIPDVKSERYTLYLSDLSHQVQLIRLVLINRLKELHNK